MDTSWNNASSQIQSSVSFILTKNGFFCAINYFNNLTHYLLIIFGIRQLVRCARTSQNPYASYGVSGKTMAETEGWPCSYCPQIHKSYRSLRNHEAKCGAGSGRELKFHHA